MRSRPSFWIGLCLLLLLAGAWFFWPAGDRRTDSRPSAAPEKKSGTAPNLAAPRPASTAPQLFGTAKNSTNTVSATTKTNPFPWQLSNTSKSLRELMSDRKAILLENALIDTGAKLDLSIPKNLQAQGDPGAYIVQARGPATAAFRAQLAAAGAEIVSYIPNNAYLVRITAAGAQRLAVFAQAVIPYEPYYKVQSPLLAYAEKSLPPGAVLNLGLFAANSADTIRQIEQLGGTILGTDQSPFGPVVRVSPPKNWTALAVLPGVQIVEGSHTRVAANDLSRETVGVSVDSVTITNYLNLDGKNVLVQVNDSGIDATHPDLLGRVFGNPAELVDPNGHGTFVAGIIAGDGTKSTTITNAQGSIMPATNGQFRGKAPMANLFSMNNGNTDQTLQEAAAFTNAPISNNSWNYAADNAYDLAAASYDAAVRDSLTRVTGSQPVLYVFSAGNAGHTSGPDNNDGGGGDPDTILSPATAKNVITVGAMEQLRNITNIVTDINSNSAPVWQPETDQSSQVAGFSSRGNVGVGVEGPNGRYKPDVTAPGTFVVSTRSQQWDEVAYYNPTNYEFNTFPDQTIGTNGVLDPYPGISVPPNAVAVIITLVSNLHSPVPFPTNLPVYAEQAARPTTTTFDILTWKNELAIPPDSGGAIGGIQSVQNGGFFYAVGNTNNFPVSYDLITEIVTTNDLGDYFEVLSNLNNSLSGGDPPYYYRYESGTSMAAADVSGVLALMEDFFMNQLSLRPSPVLLKAMLINGARVTGNYSFNPANTVNPEGWGLVNLPNSLPLSITNLVTNPGGGTSNSFFFLDQSVSNALATGDSQTFTVSIDTNSISTQLPLRVTLAWTDPPGNPAAAIKLVNNLDLVVTNLDTGEVFFGNDIPASSTFNAAWVTNGPQNLDYVNNVENVFLAPPIGGNYSITVVGREVNVNAVTAQTNNAAGVYAPNVVQDFSLVVTCGDSADGGAVSVTPNPVASNPTGSQIVTFITVTNTPLLNQLVGANTPLLGTNTIGVGTNTMWGTNGAITLGMTNQWHFYVVTNVLGFKYAAFITFLPDTLAIPRTGAFADSEEDATQPEADIDLYVADPHQIPSAYALTNLDPTVIAATDKSLTRGGVEFVTFSNSALNDVYFAGVKSETQEASEYGFIVIFSETPFSQTDANGNETVFGVPLPVNIPDAVDRAHPGKAYIFGIATTPIEVERVVVTNTIVHENFGDLLGSLSHNGKSVVLNNGDYEPNPPGPYTKIYDDSGRGDIPGSQGSDGPGTLQTFQGGEGVGPWILTEVDGASNAVGSVTGFNLFIEKHRNLTDGIQVSIAPGTWFYTFLDVPAGFTNLTISATNLPTYVVPPLQLYLNYNVQPDFSNYLDMVLLTNITPGGAGPGNEISYGPPLRPGTYYVGLFNPSFTTANAYLIAKLNGLVSPIVPTPTTTNNGPAVLDDAVSSSTLFIAATQQIASVNVGVVVTHPRISDLTFTLLSPQGQRVLLMENRGGSTTNGAGDFFVTTNAFAPVTANGGGLPQTNFLNVQQTSGSLTINWDFFTVPDEMTVYYGTNSTTFTPNAGNPFLLFDSGLISGTGSTNIIFGPGASTYVTVIMNQFTNPAGAGGTAWTYTAGGVETNYNYLTFTDSTNLTTIPIKYAVPPFTLNDHGTNYTLSDFELTTNGEYLAPTNIYDARGGWYMTNITQMLVGTNIVMVTNNYNEVSVVTDPANAATGTNYLALASGTIFRQIPMTPGKQFSLTYAYRGPGISGWWRGEGDGTDSSDPENIGNNGWLIGRFNFPAGEVGQAFAMEDAGSEFQFAGTNTYVQIHQPPVPVLITSESNPPTIIYTSPLDVGTGSGFTVEGWINPTNVSFQQPLVEWLARSPTNTAVTNLVIIAGPFINPATSHYYYLLGATNWGVSEVWARALGGHLVTIDTANEQNWVYDTFASYGGTNRNLWIGLTNNAPANPTNYVWSSGTTNLSYFNWQTNQPNFCTGNEHFTLMLGSTNVQPGLWVAADNNGLNCTFPLTNKPYGVVEVDQIQPNGVQFWISVTNMPGTTNLVSGTNGCLYANLVDITNGSHVIISPPNLVVTNVFQHVALTYNTNSGLASLYYNGTNVASTNLGYFLPKTTGDVLLGKDMSLQTNNFYGGRMDEMSIYGRSLSPAEILAIYNVSALTTNRNIGKFDQSITPALGLAEARVSLGNLTNVVLGDNTHWQSQSFSFLAATNSMLMQISGLEPGMLLDSFDVSEAPLGNLYYFPEQPLESLKGQSAYGTWTLQILDNRTGAFITNANQLVSWQLQFVLQTNTLPQVVLGFEEGTTISVPPGETVYLTVDVPVWANFATNILVSSTLPVDLLFNQTNPPTGSNPNDFTLLTGSTSGIGSPVLIANNPPLTPSVPPLLPGQTYYLGVRNPGAHAATVVVRVDFDITALTNGVPLTSVLTTNTTDAERYFVFNVTSNAYEATFQLLNLNGNADLVVRKGTPLPLLDSSDYGSFNTTNQDENIYVLTNSAPVPLSAGQWYLGVFRRDAGPVRYTVLAKTLDTPQPTVIDLTNNVPFTFTAGPGAALTNFFHFSVTNYPPSIHFELYNMSGNGDLTVQTNALPLAPPFYQTSQQPGVTPEFISIYTNSTQTNLNTTALTNLNAEWYLGVPNNSPNQITYTILAVLDTNSVFPAFPGAEGAGAGSLGGGSLPSRNGGITNTVYHVTILNDAGAGSLRAGVSSTNRTIVFDVSGTINLASPLVITNSYLTIAGQTAPGDGITVAGWETSVTNAHDVIIRYLRFRPGGSAAITNLVWYNGFEGTVPPTSTVFAPGNIAGWAVVNNSVDWYGFGGYQGSNFFDSDGVGPGTISTNIATASGAIYTLSYAFAMTDYSGTSTPKLTRILINGVPVITNVATTTMRYPSGWSTTSVVFTATSATTTLAVQSLDPPGEPSGTFMDAFSVTTNAVASGSSGNALRFVNVSNVIADHVSTSWSLQQVTAALGSANLTMQWSMINDSLYSTTTANGGSFLNLGNGALTFHHNLYANNYAGSPHLNDNLSLDFVNNVIYDWGTNAGFSFGDPLVNPVGFTNQLNYVCNYLIAGSNSFAPQIAFWGGSTNTWIFQTNNFIDSDTNHILDGANTGWNMFTNRFTKFDRPFPLAPVATDEAFKAYERVLDFAGLSMMARDSADTNTITGVRDYTGTIISASGALPVLVSMLQFLDRDLDGIPDFWETTFGQFPTNVSNFLPSSYAPGYTDLEEYLNWLGAPHALTITNTPVSVDLQKLFGNTGKLSFEVTNSVNGLVYLTNVLSYTNSLGVGINVTNTGPFSNSIAVFTPTNNLPSGTNYFGYAAFDVTVTNNETFAYFGPVTVSVVVSSVPITYATSNTNTPPVFTNGNPTNQTIDELTLLTVTNTATSANTNLTLSYMVTMIVDTNAMILNGWPLTFATTTPSPVIDTNGIITWTPTELQGPGVYIITTVVTDNSFPPLSATNSFSVTVNESNMPPFWPPNVPDQTNYTLSALVTLVVTNTATDADIPTNPLTYQLIVSPPVGNATIDANGIITWTPTISQVGLFTFTTVVTDTNIYALVNKSLSATNVFTVFVTPVIAPFAFTEPAQSVTGTSAQLNGMATPNGLPTVAWFEWGTTTNYGNVTPVVNIGNSYNVVYTTSPISGLLTNVPYHFRLVVSNAFAAVHGFDQVLDEAYVVVWGADYVGQANVPGGLSNAVAIAGAYDHSLALRINGTAAAWGDNTFGQSTVPPGLNGLVAVAGGQLYSMVLKNNGTVAAWGAGVLGQTNVPSGLNNVVNISGGTFCSLALKINGSVVAWGAPFFNLTNVPPGASNVVAVAGGGFHNLAIVNNGTVMAWGDNSAGQTNLPAGLSNVVAVAAGNYHSLALRSDGTVVSWGDNSASQTNVPPGLNNVVAIAAGGFHSLALKGDGSVVAWGDNSAGQRSVPVGLTNVVAISSGYFHSMALTPQSLASLTNPVVLNLTNNLPQTNTILAGGLTYYRVNVPTNADFATNSLLFAFNGPLNVWFSTNTPPTIAGANDSLLLGGLTNGISILSTNTAPTNIVPGRIYYLGVNNTNNFAVTYGIEVDFHLLISTNPPSFTNSVPISSIIYTNIGGTNGFLLTWFAPSNALFQVQWTDNLPPSGWQTFTNPPFVSYNPAVFTNPTNTQFNFFDDGTQTGGFGPTRFYRLVLFGTAPPPVNTAPVLPAQTNRTINPLNPLVVTNTATDAQSPPQTLSYTLLNPPVGAVINTNGVITWTPAVAQAGTTNVITTVVTDNGTPNLSATNTFSVVVNPLPDISSVVFTNGGFLLTWWAPTNDIFEVQLATSLAPPVTWQTFTNIITYTGPATPTNGLFTFFDDGSQFPFGGLRFYRLVLLGVTTVSSNTPPVLPAQTNRTINPLNPLVVTNTATDAQSPPQTLSYTLLNPPVGAVINTNGVITWTPAVAQAGTTNVITTVVTDNGTPNLSATNTFSVVVNPLPDISSVVFTNGGFLLSWWAPTNDIFEVQLATSLAPPVTWQTFTNIITYTGPATPTNGLFTFFDDGSQFPFGGLRFYRLVLLGVTTVSSNTPPVLPAQTNRTINPLNPLVVTNTATDAQSPPQTLSYTLLNPPVGAVINTNGVITWTPAVAQAGTTNVITTVVTDNGTPNLSATNTFSVVVNPLPDISSVVFTNGGFLLSWWAPTNDIFEVQLATSLAPPVTWQTFTNIITYTGPATPTNGLFTFFDDGSQFPFGGLRFYRLVLLGVTTVSSNTPPVLPAQTNRTINPLNPLVVTNTATDAQSPPQTLSYTLLNPPVGAVINTNGVITWTPAVAQAGTTNVITTVVTDNGTPNLSATNTFSVVVNPLPDISSVVFTNGGFLLSWWAPTNDIFEVQLATSLAPPVTWQTFTNIITYTGPATPTNGLFTFFDDGSQFPFGGLRFYRLVLLGVTTVSSNTPPVLPAQTNRTINPLNPLVVTNTATDAQSPPQTLSYTLLNPPVGAVINTNGVITWTPAVAQAGTTNVITTVVTDNGTPNLSATNTFSVVVNPLPDISSVVFTNGGFLLTWWAPTNDIFEVQLATSLAPPVTWQTFTNIITYTGPATPTNGLFTFFDDGSQFPFGGLRFYRLVLLGVTTVSSNTPPVLPAQTNRTVNPLNPLVVTNTATDAQSPPQTLSYTLLNPPVGAVINTNGVITWTPAVAQAGTTNVITTVVTDNGTPNLSATNTFSVVVNPLPDISSVVFTNGGFLLTWWAPTNDIFEVQLATSLAPPVTWQTFTNIITYTGPATPTNGLFTFFDDGSQFPFGGLRFYRLVLLGVTPPVVPPATNTVPISSIVSTNGNFLLTWFATTNNQFKVQWTTNIAPPATWSVFTGGPITSTNGTFTFRDTNAPLLMKFYELLLLP